MSTNDSWSWPKIEDLIQNIHEKKTQQDIDQVVNHEQKESDIIDDFSKESRKKSVSIKEVTEKSQKKDSKVDESLTKISKEQSNIDISTQSIKKEIEDYSDPAKKESKNSTSINQVSTTSKKEEQTIDSVSEKSKKEISVTTTPVSSSKEDSNVSIKYNNISKKDISAYSPIDHENKIETESETTKSSKKSESDISIDQSTFKKSESEEDLSIKQSKKTETIEDTDKSHYRRSDSSLDLDLDHKEKEINELNEKRSSIKKEEIEKTVDIAEKSPKTDSAIESKQIQENKSENNINSPSSSSKKYENSLEEMSAVLKKTETEITHVGKPSTKSESLISNIFGSSKKNESEVDESNIEELEKSEKNINNSSKPKNKTETKITNSAKESKKKENSIVDNSKKSEKKESEIESTSEESKEEVNIDDASEGDKKSEVDIQPSYTGDTKYNENSFYGSIIESSSSKPVTAVNTINSNKHYQQNSNDTFYVNENSSLSKTESEISAVDEVSKEEASQSANSVVGIDNANVSITTNVNYPISTPASGQINENNYITSSSTRNKDKADNSPSNQTGSTSNISYDEGSTKIETQTSREISANGTNKKKDTTKTSSSIDSSEITLDSESANENYNYQNVSTAKSFNEINSGYDKSTSLRNKYTEVSQNSAINQERPTISSVKQENYSFAPDTEKSASITEDGRNKTQTSSSGPNISYNVVPESSPSIAEDGKNKLQSVSADSAIDSFSSTTSSKNASYILTTPKTRQITEDGYINTEANRNKKEAQSSVSIVDSETKFDSIVTNNIVSSSNSSYDIVSPYSNIIENVGYEKDAINRNKEKDADKNLQYSPEIIYDSLKPGDKVNVYGKQIEYSVPAESDRTIDLTVDRINIKRILSATDAYGNYTFNDLIDTNNRNVENSVNTLDDINYTIVKQKITQLSNDYDYSIAETENTNTNIKKWYNSTTDKENQISDVGIKTQGIDFGFNYSESPLEITGVMVSGGQQQRQNYSYNDANIPVKTVEVIKNLHISPIDEYETYLPKEDVNSHYIGSDNLIQEISDSRLLFATTFSDGRFDNSLVKDSSTGKKYQAIKNFDYSSVGPLKTKYKVWSSAGRAGWYQIGEDSKVSSISQNSVIKTNILSGDSLRNLVYSTSFKSTRLQESTPRNYEESSLSTEKYQWQTNYDYSAVEAANIVSSKDWSVSSSEDFTQPVDNHGYDYQYVHNQNTPRNITLVNSSVIYGDLEPPIENKQQITNYNYDSLIDVATQNKWKSWYSDSGDSASESVPDVSKFIFEGTGYNSTKSVVGVSPYDPQASIKAAVYQQIKTVIDYNTWNSIKEKKLYNSQVLSNYTYFSKDDEEKTLEDVVSEFSENSDFSPIYSTKVETLHHQYQTNFNFEKIEVQQITDAKSWNVSSGDDSSNSIDIGYNYSSKPIELTNVVDYIKSSENVIEQQRQNYEYNSIIKSTYTSAPSKDYSVPTSNESISTSTKIGSYSIKYSQESNWNYIDTTSSTASYSSSHYISDPSLAKSWYEANSATVNSSPFYKGDLFTTDSSKKKTAIEFASKNVFKNVIDKSDLQLYQYSTQTFTYPETVQYGFRKEYYEIEGDRQLPVTLSKGTSSSYGKIISSTADSLQGTPKSFNEFNDLSDSEKLKYIPIFTSNSSLPKYYLKSDNEILYSHIVDTTKNLINDNTVVDNYTQPTNITAGALIIGKKLSNKYILTPSTINQESINFNYSSGFIPHYISRKSNDFKFSGETISLDGFDVLKLESTSDLVINGIVKGISALTSSQDYLTGVREPVYNFDYQYIASDAVRGVADTGWIIESKGRNVYISGVDNSDSNFIYAPRKYSDIKLKNTSDDDKKKLWRKANRPRFINMSGEELAWNLGLKFVNSASNALLATRPWIRDFITQSARSVKNWSNPKSIFDNDAVKSAIDSNSLNSMISSLDTIKNQISSDDILDFDYSVVKRGLRFISSELPRMIQTELMNSALMSTSSNTNIYAQSNPERADITLMSGRKGFSGIPKEYGSQTANATKGSVSITGAAKVVGGGMFGTLGSSAGHIFTCYSSYVRALRWSILGLSTSGDFDGEYGVEGQAPTENSYHAIDNYFLKENKFNTVIKDKTNEESYIRDYAKNISQGRKKGADFRDYYQARTNLLQFGTPQEFILSDDTISASINLKKVDSRYDINEDRNSYPSPEKLDDSYDNDRRAYVGNFSPFDENSRTYSLSKRLFKDSEIGSVLNALNITSIDISSNAEGTLLNASSKEKISPPLSFTSIEAKAFNKSDGSPITGAANKDDINKNINILSMKTLWRSDTTNNNILAIQNTSSLYNKTTQSFNDVERKTSSEKFSHVYIDKLDLTNNDVKDSIINALNDPRISNRDFELENRDTFIYNTEHYEDLTTFNADAIYKYNSEGAITGSDNEIHLTRLYLSNPESEKDKHGDTQLVNSWRVPSDFDVASKSASDLQSLYENGKFYNSLLDSEYNKSISFSHVIPYNFEENRYYYSENLTQKARWTYNNGVATPATLLQTEKDRAISYTVNKPATISIASSIFYSDDSDGKTKSKITSIRANSENKNDTDLASNYMSDIKNQNSVINGDASISIIYNEKSGENIIFSNNRLVYTAALKTLKGSNSNYQNDKVGSVDYNIRKISSPKVWSIDDDRLVAKIALDGDELQRKKSDSKTDGHNNFGTDKNFYILSNKYKNFKSSYDSSDKNDITGCGYLYAVRFAGNFSNNGANIAIAGSNKMSTSSSSTSTLVIPFQFDAEIASIDRQANWNQVNAFGRSSDWFVWSNSTSKAATLKTSYAIVAPEDGFDISTWGEKLSADGSSLENYKAINPIYTNMQYFNERYILALLGKYESLLVPFSAGYSPPIVKVRRGPMEWSWSRKGGYHEISWIATDISIENRSSEAGFTFSRTPRLFDVQMSLKEVYMSWDDYSTAWGMNQDGSAGTTKPTLTSDGAILSSSNRIDAQSTNAKGENKGNTFPGLIASRLSDSKTIKDNW